MDLQSVEEKMESLRMKMTKNSVICLHFTWQTSTKHVIHQWPRKAKHIDNVSVEVLLFFRLLSFPTKKKTKLQILFFVCQKTSRQKYKSCIVSLPQNWSLLRLLVSFERDVFREKWEIRTICKFEYFFVWYFMVHAFEILRIMNMNLFFGEKTKKN